MTSISPTTIIEEPSDDKDLLTDIATQFRAGVELKDRKYHLTTYPSCFVGRAAVDFLINNGLANSREEAVLLGQSIMTELSLFEHVTRDHEFKDDYLYYHFAEVCSYVYLIYSSWQMSAHIIYQCLLTSYAHIICTYLCSHYVTFSHIIFIHHIHISYYAEGRCIYQSHHGEEVSVE